MQIEWENKNEYNLRTIHFEVRTIFISLSILFSLSIFSLSIVVSHSHSHSIVFRISLKNKRANYMYKKRLSFNGHDTSLRSNGVLIVNTATLLTTNRVRGS